MEASDIRREQFSAKFSNPYGRPTSAPPQRVRDVLICATDASVEAGPDEFREHPPVASDFLARTTADAAPVDLGRGVVIDQLSREDAELVMNACTPRGHYFSPIRQFGQRYSFVREVGLEDVERHPYAWDRDGVLFDALSLSRLIRDNGYSTEYAGRVIDYEDGEQMVVYHLGGESRQAYRVRRDREWLDVREAIELRELLASWWSSADALPPRVRRAMWRTEYSSWLKWGDLVIPTLAGGLEALLKTERFAATRQFVQRVPALAGELGLGDVNSEFCDRMYDMRSAWVHGAHVQLIATGSEAEERRREGTETPAGSPIFADVARLQDVLRAAVRRCLEDGEFCATFADDDAIRARWPVSTRGATARG